MGSRLEGKVAVVTGGGRGIGRQVALLLAEEGASVVVNDTGDQPDGTGSSHGPADAVAAEIDSRGGRAVASYDDVALMEGGDAVIEAAVDAFGRLDALVNSVALIRDASAGHTIAEMEPGDFDRVIRSAVKATFTPTRYAAVHFRQQRSGRIVNLTAEIGPDQPGHSNDAAASEAVVGLTRTVARDLGKYGVTCNCITSTPDAGPLPDAGDNGRGLGPPDGYDAEAALAVYLCSGAPPQVNGNVFGVRGNDIYLHSNPIVVRSVHKWGAFTMDEMDALVPGVVG